LHAAVLRALQSEAARVDDPARLAHHAEAAGDREAVLAYAPAAARRAVELRASREATAQYARALRFSQGLPDHERLALLEAYAAATDLADWGAAGIAPREEMIALARRSGDLLKVAEHMGWLSITLHLAGRRDDADQSTRAALAILDALPESPTHAGVYCNLAELGVMSRDIVGAVAWGARAVALAEELGDLQTLILALNTVGEARLVGGDEGRGRADLERCLELARGTGSEGFIAGTLAHLGTGFAESYRFVQSDRYLSEAIAYATEHDLDGWHQWSTAWLATTRLFQGRWTEATDLAASVLRLPTFAELVSDDRDLQIATPSYSVPTYVRIAALVPLGRVRARRGDPEVVRVLDEARSLAEQLGDHYSSSFVFAARAKAAWLAGDHKQTASEAREAFHIASQRRQTWLAGELAYWCWKAGDSTAPPPSAAAPFALQVAGDWAAAAALWDSLSCPYEAARALAEGDDKGALIRALAEFDRLGARPAAIAVTRRLRELGARGIPRGPRPATRANPANLTPRELEILPLIAQGLRNAEIAGRLFLSAKTVDHHVSSILTKLGVRSRAEVAHQATRLGLHSQDGDPSTPK
jgi:DNA-binding CsgD family transcriptional regulator